ncbi:hypothetical protein AALP_AA6G007700 [Arabis alpina]|uniref:ADF-H domain-containing protein n=1 Tax=Arabis alpina TaxID=50452 RepID=A0A087GL84_ARAAL|nr:hypothetical protein AALP_AA6G007700 [Arabis alpina]
MANSASGMHVNDECKLKFLELKAKRTYRYIVFTIDETAQQVLIEKLGNPEETYDDFTNSMPENECRYAVYDFDFTTEDNCQKSKIFFIAWSPDTSRVRSKMLYASSKDRFKREMEGIQLGIPIQKGEAHLSVIKAWKEQKITKVTNKTQKKLLQISGWEKKKTTKIDSELASIQRKMDNKKLEKAEKLRKKKVAVHASAQEQKAKVQIRRAQEILDAEEEAARFQATGQVPKKPSLSCF